MCKCILYCQISFHGENSNELISHFSNKNISTVKATKNFLFTYEKRKFLNFSINQRKVWWNGGKRYILFSLLNELSQILFLKKKFIGLFKLDSYIYDDSLVNKINSTILGRYICYRYFKQFYGIQNMTNNFQTSSATQE